MHERGRHYDAEGLDDAINGLAVEQAEVRACPVSETSTQVTDTQPDPISVQFLRRLATTSSLSELLDLLLEDSTWMVESKYKEIYELATRHSAKNLVSRISWLAEIADLFQFTASLPSFDDYAKRAASHPILVSDEFRDFMLKLSKQQGLITDSLSSILEQWSSRQEQVNKILHLHDVLENGKSPIISEEIPPAEAVAHAANEHTPLAVSWSTLDYIYAILSVACRPDNTNQETGERLASWLETLETISFNAHQLRADRRVLRGMNSGRAAIWYVFAVPIPTAMSLIDAVRSEKLTLDEAVQNIQDATLKELGDQIRSRTDRNFTRACASGAFCVLSAATIGTVKHTRSCLSKFRSVLDSSWTTNLPPHYQASLVWRYSAFVFQHLAEIEDLRHALEDCSALLSNCPPLTDYPGLTRDLKLAHARVLVELTRWLPSQINAALELFKEGLNVRWAKYDSEARGQGLSDLAGALSRSFSLNGTDITEAAEGRVVSLYNEAGFFLSAATFPLGRMTMLMNFAIFLNERKHADYSSNQEHALAVIDEALAIARDLDRQPDSPAFTHAEQVRASVWQTRGNIIRMRTHGGRASHDSAFLVDVGTLPTGMSPWAVGALSCYHEALRVLEDANIRTPLRGQIHLNMAITYVDELRRSYSEDKAARADRHLRLARETIQDISHLEARATLEEIELEFLCGVSQAKVQTSDRIKLACRSALQVAQAGYVETAVGASIVAATRAMQTGRPVDLETTEMCMKGILALTESRSCLAPVYSADLLVQLARISVLRSLKSSDVGRHLELAISFGTVALDRLREELGSHDFVGNRLSISGRMAVLAADVAWMRLRGARSKHEVLESPELMEILAVAAETDAQLVTGEAVSEGLGADRSLMLAAEDLIWSQGGKVFVEQNMAREFDMFQTARHLFEVKRELHAISSQREGVVESLVHEARHHGIAIQFVVSEWGGHAIIYTDGSAADIVTLELSRTEIRRWIFGAEDARGWLAHYHTRNESEQAWSEWMSACDQLSSAIGERVWGPILKAGVSLDGADVAVIPGALAGLPLHAGLLDDGRYVIGIFSGFAYAKGTKRHEVPALGRVLFALSDPKRVGGQRLDDAPCEVSALAKICLDGGASVEVLLDSWGMTTRDVFSTNGCPLPDAAELVGRPTREEVLARVSDVDLFVYSGHGNGIGNVGGYLVLADDEGAPVDVSIVSMMRLQLLQRRPGIILSACETAWEVMGNSQGSSSVASTFVRLGASSVMGSLWKIPDAEASQVSCSYTERMTSGLTPSRAFVETVRGLAADGKPASRWGAYCLWLG